MLSTSPNASSSRCWINAPVPRANDQISAVPIKALTPRSPGVAGGCGPSHTHRPGRIARGQPKLPSMSHGGPCSGPSAPRPVVTSEEVLRVEQRKRGEVDRQPGVDVRQCQERSATPSPHESSDEKATSSTPVTSSARGSSPTTSTTPITAVATFARRHRSGHESLPRCPDRLAIRNSLVPTAGASVHLHASIGTRGGGQCYNRHLDRAREVLLRGFHLRTRRALHPWPTTG